MTATKSVLSANSQFILMGILKYFCWMVEILSFVYKWVYWLFNKIIVYTWIGSASPHTITYNVTRGCNYPCGCCFNNEYASFVLPLSVAKRGLKMLSKAGMKKIKFSGGDPFLVKHGEYLGKLIKYCKTDLKVETVTIVSNGTKLESIWFDKYGKYVDILAIRCDSCDEEINKIYGRRLDDKSQVQILEQAKRLCLRYGVLFKMITRINNLNFDEDMTEIMQFKPFQWEICPSVLENGKDMDKSSLRRMKYLSITEKQFQLFMKCHSHVNRMVFGTNDGPTLNENMRFLNDQRNRWMKPSRSIFDVGVKTALCNYPSFDVKAFDNTNAEDDNNNSNSPYRDGGKKLKLSRNNFKKRHIMSAIKEAKTFDSECGDGGETKNKRKRLQRK